MPKTTRKPVPTTSKNAQPAKPTSALDKIAELISNGKTRDAVMAAIKLPTTKLTAELTRFIKDNASLIHVEASEAEQTAKQTEKEFEEVSATLAKVKEAKDKAEAAKKQRVADEVRFLYAVVVTHKIFTRQEIVDAWGVSKQWVTNRLAVSKKAAVVNATSAADLAFMADAVRRDSAALTQVLAKPEVTMKDVRAAVTEARAKKSGEPVAAPKVKPEPEPASVTANKLAAQLTANLVLLTKNRTRIADVGERDGERELTRLLDAIREYHAMAATLTDDGEREPTAEDLAKLEAIGEGTNSSGNVVVGH